MAAPATGEKSRIYHVASREVLRRLRDDILRLHGFEVVSTLSFQQAIEDISNGSYSLVLIDIESEARVEAALRLCEEVKKIKPKQHVAYACNYRVSIHADCPDEIIRSEFKPEELVRSIRQAIANFAEEAG